MSKVMKVCAALVLVGGMASQAWGEQRRTVDIAICLDTSGSMSGLINSARQKMWQIVSELAVAKPEPRLRVALLTYGTPRYGADSGFVHVDHDLTDDLDAVYETLFALRTEGGDEYVARAVKTAVESLSWDEDTRSLRMIFVAGNESAEQDPVVTNEDACEQAARSDTIVNTIYCGAEGSRDAEGYRRVATLADGRFAAIDHNSGTLVIKTPYDDELARLSSELNTTYIAYGTKRKKYAMRQSAQDSNAASMSTSASAERAVAKSSSLYSNESWDAVDATERGGQDVNDIPKDQLPEEMRDMTDEERTAYVEEKSKERKEIQAKIKETSAKRTAYIQDEMKKKSLKEEGSFDAAVRGAVREQAEKKGFRF